MSQDGCGRYDEQTYILLLSLLAILPSDRHGLLATLLDTSLLSNELGHLKDRPKRG